MDGRHLHHDCFALLCHSYKAEMKTGLPLKQYCMGVQLILSAQCINSV